MAMPGRNDSTRETPTVQGASVHGQAAGDMHSPGSTADDMFLATRATDSFERIPPSPSHYHPAEQKFGF